MLPTIQNLTSTIKNIIEQEENYQKISSATQKRKRPKKPTKKKPPKISKKPFKKYNIKKNLTITKKNFKQNPLKIDYIKESPLINVKKRFQNRMLSVEFQKPENKRSKTQEDENISEGSMKNFNMGLTKTVNLNDLEDKEEKEKQETLNKQSKYSKIIQNMTTKKIEAELKNKITKKMDSKLKLRRRNSHQPIIKRKTQIDYKKNMTNTTIYEKESLSMYSKIVVSDEEDNKHIKKPKSQFGAQMFGRKRNSSVEDSFDTRRHFNKIDDSFDTRKREGRDSSERFEGLKEFKMGDLKVKGGLRGKGESFKKSKGGIHDSYDMISHNNLGVSKNNKVSRKFSKQEDDVLSGNFENKNETFDGKNDNGINDEENDGKNDDGNSDDNFSFTDDGEIIGNNLYEIQDERGNKFVLKKEEDIKIEENREEEKIDLNHTINSNFKKPSDVKVQFFKAKTQRVPTFHFMENTVEKIHEYEERISEDNKKITSIHDHILKLKPYIKKGSKKNTQFSNSAKKNKNLKIGNLGNYFKKKNMKVIEEDEDIREQNHIDNYFKKIQNNHLKRKKTKKSKSLINRKQLRNDKFMRFKLQKLQIFLEESL